MLSTLFKRLVALLSPYLFWLAFITISILLLIEMQPSEPGWPYFDKLVHAIMFFTLGILGYIAYNKHIVLLYISLACYGVLTECLQSLITETRFGSIYDWFADLTGILLSLILISVAKAFFKKSFNGS